MTVKKLDKKVSKRDAVNELWNRGKLVYKLKGTQIDVYNAFKEANDDINVICCSRRFGKSFILCLLAVEECISRKDAVIKYACPTQKQVKEIVRKIMRPILDDCPPHLKPEWKEAEKLYLFPNGSEIQMAGTDNGNIENIRGGHAHLCIVDEAGFATELDYAVDNVLAPTTDTTNGKVILASTPNYKDPNHVFNIEYVLPRQHAGTLRKFTIHDAPMISEDRKQKIIARYGEDNPRYRCEYLCIDENMPIKTKDGYKKIKNISIGEEVFTHKGRYKKVVNKFKNKRNNRNMYKVKTSNNQGLICTEGHKLYIAAAHTTNELPEKEATWKEVQHINTSSKILNRTYAKVPIDLEENTINLSKELAYLAGWHLAEGHTNKNLQVLSLNYNDDFETINTLTREVWGKEYKIYTKTNTCFQAQLNSKSAQVFYDQFGKGAKNKNIPTLYKKAQKEIKCAILKGLFAGDGFLNVDKKLAGLSSISIELIRDVSDILLSLGIEHTYSKFRNKGQSVILGREVNVNNCYQIRINTNNFDKFADLIYDLKLQTKSRNSRNFISDGYLYSRITNITKLDSYDKEYVWDIEVEDDHSYVGSHITCHNCEVAVDPEKLVIGEFNPEKEQEIVKDMEVPSYCDYYVSMDIGFRDLTGVLFAYFDFMKSTIVILDELIINGAMLTSEHLAEEIRKKEIELFANRKSGMATEPTLRISDNNNPILLNDLFRLHNLSFVATAKDNKEAQINEVKLRIKQNRIIISPKCKTLRYHLKAAKWDKKRKGFERLKDIKETGVRGGHADLLDALIYLVRNVMVSKDPFPDGYFDLSGSNVFATGKSNANSKALDFMRKILNINKK